MEGEVCKPCIEKVEEAEREEPKKGRPKKLDLSKLASIAVLVLLLSAAAAEADVTPIPVKIGNETLTPCYVYVVEKPVPHYVTVTKIVTKTVTVTRYVESPAMSALAVVIPLLAAIGAFAGNMLSRRQVEEVKEL